MRGRPVERAEGQRDEDRDEGRAGRDEARERAIPGRNPAGVAGMPCRHLSLPLNANSCWHNIRRRVNNCQQMLANTRCQRISLDIMTHISRVAAAAASQVGPGPGTGETLPAPGTEGSLGTGGPRSEGTRRAILGAARATFAARGYEQATIRAVAARAGVDASMVMRYFRSKAGLFTAAVTMDLQVPDLRSVPASDRGESLTRHFISRWEDPTRDDEMIALLRTAATSETVAEQLQEVFAQLVTKPIADLGDK